MNERWIDRLKQLGVFAVAQRLGLDVDEKKRCVYGCPACGAETRHTKRADKRGALSIKNDEHWHCWQCDAGGDAVDLLAFKTAGAKFSACAPEQKSRVREAALREVPSTGGSAGAGDTASRGPSKPRAPKREARNYPPADELAFVWDAATPIADHPPALAWLAEQRGLDAAAVAAVTDVRYLAQQLDEQRAPWAGIRRRKDQLFVGWFDLHHHVLFPLYDAAGVMRSLVARRAPDVKRNGPKALPPTGFECGGLVLADRLGRRMLAGELGDLAQLHLDVVIAEGEVDVAAWAAAPYTAAGRMRIVLGVRSGSWTPALAARIPDGSRVVLAADLDLEGEKYCTQILTTLRGRALDVRRWPLERPDVAPNDANDWVRAGLPLVPDGAPLDVAARGDVAGVDDDRVEVFISTNERAVNDQAISALVKTPDLYRRGGVLVRVGEEDELPRGLARELGSPVIHGIPNPRLREMLTERVAWKRIGRNGEPANAHPPDWSVTAIAARGSWPELRHLEAIVESPVLVPGGRVLQTPGYDAETGLLYKPRFDYPPVPEHPTDDQLAESVAMLDDVVHDFVFQRPGHRSSWFASFLTPLCRYAFHGAAPLFLFEAATPGTGKGLLSDIAGLIGTGRLAARSSFTDDDGELEKRVLSWAMAGVQLVCFDNVVGIFGGGELCKTLTATTINGRILGASQNWAGPLFITWMATANNVQLGPDMSRRVCPIRILSPVEHPEERRDFKYPNLTEHVRARLPQLVVAALTIARAYFVSSTNPPDLAGWGGFEGWSSVVRAALKHAGLPDPADTRAELRKAGDDRARLQSQLVVGWRDLCERLLEGNRGVTVKRALAAVYGVAEEECAFPKLRAALDELCGSRGQQPTTQRVGFLFRGMQDRIFAGNLSFQCVGEDRDGSRLWLARTAVYAGAAGDTAVHGAQVSQHRSEAVGQLPLQAMRGSDPSPTFAREEQVAGRIKNSSPVWPAVSPASPPSPAPDHDPGESGDFDREPWPEKEPAE